MKAYLHTLGCKVNTIESDSIAALLTQHDYTLCAAPEEAEVIILNSCTVTASGDKRTLKTLRTLRNAAPDAVIVLTGCYAQAFPEEAAALPEADIILGTRNRSAIPALLEAYFQHPQRLTAVQDYQNEDIFEALPQGTDSAHTRAFLKIQDGCDRFCTYCIIPYARGRSRSRAPEALMQAAQQLRAEGFQELVLCGINLACWGRESGQTLADAVQLCAKAGFPRVRLGSLEPDGLTEEVLQRLAEIPALCPHFHLSVQSGCDRTLRAMGRPYTAAEFAALTERIRDYFPGAAVTTDIIVGFPGETEEDFAETVRFAGKMAFSKMHVFRYSPRPGTAAADFPEQIPESVKKERSDCLSELGRLLHNAFLYDCLGKTLSVLFECERDGGFHIGHAENYAAVLVPAQEGDGDWRNSIRNVHITDVQDGKLIGRAESVWRVKSEE